MFRSSRDCHASVFLRVRKCNGCIGTAKQILRSFLNVKSELECGCCFWGRGAEHKSPSATVTWWPAPTQGTSQGQGAANSPFHSTGVVFMSSSRFLLCRLPPSRASALPCSGEGCWLPCCWKVSWCCKTNVQPTVEFQKLATVGPEQSCGVFKMFLTLLWKVRKSFSDWCLKMELHARAMYDMNSGSAIETLTRAMSFYALDK